MNGRIVDAIDDIGQTRCALNALVDLMMPQTCANQDDLSHVNRGELALLLGVLNQQLARELMQARELATGKIA